MAKATPLEQPTTPLPPTAASGFWHTLWFLIAFYTLSVVWGVRNIRFREPSDLDLLMPVAFAICLGWWAIVDARRRGGPIPVLARPWFFLLAGVVVPGYVIWSRRWRGVGWVVLHAALWFVLATVAMHAGGMFVYGYEWLRPSGG
jgi:hypothetical protein